jgi:hypothetical protein
MSLNTWMGSWAVFESRMLVQQSSSWEEAPPHSSVGSMEVDSTCLCRESLIIVRYLASSQLGVQHKIHVRVLAECSTGQLLAIASLVYYQGRKAVIWWRFS